MNNYKSTKLFEGYSTAFRQWRASHSHCKFVHGYALKFKVTFEGNLDELNWVCDFGCFKRNGIKEHMNYMFDHTTVVAKNDPELESFKLLADKKLIQLRIIDHVGCEKFAEYVYNYIDKEINKDYLNITLSSNDTLRDKIHEIHNFLRNNGAGYGMSALKVFTSLAS